jgi:rhodanese-related sulfurtransferase/uncharacterized protein YndB with AHSA1/START domain
LVIFSLLALRRQSIRNGGEDALASARYAHSAKVALRRPGGGILNRDADRFAPVTRAVRATAEEIWAALTEPDAVGKWWGEISAPFQRGHLSQLTLGDGDVHLLEIIELKPPRHLELGRRLFGIGPKELICWQISAKEDGCLVTVSHGALDPETDREAVEPAEWVLYTDRLEKWLEKAPLALVPRTREFVLSADLPGDAASVRAHLMEHLAKVFESSRGSFGGSYQASPLLDDCGEPKDFQITLGPADACSVLLDVAHATWVVPTTARLHLRQREQGTRLTVQHGGWAAISFDDETRTRQRARFARFWHRFFVHFTLQYARSWQIPTLSAVDLQSRMPRQDVFVFDTNRTSLWERGHVPQSIFVGQEDIPIDRLPGDKNAELVFYCRDAMCLTAYLSAAQARTLGYPNTFVMKGGRAAWAKSGFPLVSTNGMAASDQDDPEAFDAGA